MLSKIVRPFKNAIIIVLWIFLMMAWLGGIMYGLEEIGRHGSLRWSAAIALSICTLLSYFLADRWIKIAPGLMVYGVLHGITMLLGAKRPEGTTSYDLFQYIVLFIICASGCTYISLKRLQWLDKVFLAIFTTTFFLPVIDSMPLSLSASPALLALGGAAASVAYNDTARKKRLREERNARRRKRRAEQNQIVDADGQDA